MKTDNGSWQFASDQPVPMTTELMRIETITPHELFKPGTLDPVLGRIRQEVMREAAALDISTEANRKALNSLAFKVTKSKTFIEAQRKNLVAGEKERLKAIDKEGGRVWDELEKLATEVRKPLTDWENADKERIGKHEANLATMNGTGDIISQQWQTLPLDGMKLELESVKTMDYDWQEFHARAVAVAVKVIGQVKDAIAKREKWDAEQEELIRLREETARRAQQDHEARIAREAKEKAEAEAKRRAEVVAKAAREAQERVEREKVEAEARAKQAEAQRFQVEKQAKAQEEAAKQSAARAAKEAAERLEQEKERAETARVAAIAKAEADKAAAIEAERKRAEEAKRKAEAETKAREKDKSHRAEVHSDALAAIVWLGISEENAKQVVTAIAKGLIPNVKITY